MTIYRCLVHNAHGEFIPYAGRSFELASEAMRAYEQTATAQLQRLDDDGWRTVIGVYRTHKTPEHPERRLLQLAASHAVHALAQVQRPCAG